MAKRIENICIYHADCNDGFTAAWVLYRKFGTNNCKFFAATYGSKPPEVFGMNVYVVDFSYRADVLFKIAEDAKSLVVLDHHKTAMEDLQFFNHPKTKVVFDMSRSGAGLAWDYLFDGMQRPELVELAEDRDLWGFWGPDTKELFAAISCCGACFEELDEIEALLQTPIGRWEFIRTGSAFLLYAEYLIKKMLRFEFMIEIDGHKVPCFNIPPIFQSDLLAIASKGWPFAVAYCDSATERKFSMRSKDTGLDVSEIAKKFGGGGHVRAAGFSVKIEKDVFKRL